MANAAIFQSLMFCPLSITALLYTPYVEYDNQYFILQLLIVLHVSAFFLYISPKSHIYSTFQSMTSRRLSEPYAQPRTILPGIDILPYGGMRSTGEADDYQAVPIADVDLHALCHQLSRRSGLCGFYSII